MAVNILKNISDNLHRIIKIKFNKISVLLFLIIFFAIIYMLLDDSHFAGINKFKEAVKDEVIKKKAKQEIQENFNNFNAFNAFNNYDTFVKEDVIDKAAKQTEKEVEKKELNPEKVEPNLANKFLNRIYFATSTGCLLGYGDIYPVTDLCKIITGIQGILTIALIIY